MQTQPPVKEQNQYFKKLQKLTKQLPKTTKQQSFYAETLQQIDAEFVYVDVDKITKLQPLLYDVMKPLARQITNYSPREIATFKLMKSIILKILKFYCTLFVKHHHISALQIIKQLINRENILFVKTFFRTGAAPTAFINTAHSAVQKLIEQQQKDSNNDIEQQTSFKWSKGRMGHTTFHRECCEVIMCQLNKQAERLQVMKLSTIKQLMGFMFFLQDYIFQQKMHQFAINCYQSLNRLACKPSKQQIKQSTKQLFQEISQKLIRMLHYYNDKQLKQQILLLGSTFSINLLHNDPSIETKLHGLRMLEKFAYQFYYRSSQSLKDDVYAEWLLENGMWDVLIGRQADWAIVHSSEYLLKMIVNKKGKLSEEKFKEFLTITWQAKEDIRRCYFKSLDPLKLSYTNISLIISNFRTLQPSTQLYIDEFFYLVQSICRYGSDSQRNATIQILMAVIKRYYYQWKEYSLQRKALDSLKYCFEKLADGVKDFSQRAEMYVALIQQLINEPSQLMLTVVRKIFQSQEKSTSYAIQKAARILVQQKKAIQTIITLMSQPISYKTQLMYFLKAILTKYKSYSMETSLSLPEQILTKATAYPEAFTQLVSFSNPKDCQKLLQKLFEEIYQKEINFQCIKELFYKANSVFIEVIESEYFRRKEYRVRVDPEQLYFMKQIQLLLVTCQYPKVQQHCAQLIADCHTVFSSSYRQKGKLHTRQFIQQLITRLEDITIQNQSLHIQQHATQLYGLLSLTSQLLSATEIHGVGDMRAHNSLVTTSMLKVKIWNNASYGDDVQKCYEKTLPSNMTLFQLLSVIGEKFKCGQHQLYLQQGNNLAIPQKMNGHTLLELGFAQFRQFNAYKNTKVQTHKQPLKINNDLDPRFLTIVKQIFHMFQKDGKMQEDQIVNYIRGVTNSPSHSKDSRVQNLLKDYDSDKDGSLTQQDLLRFYSDSCDGGDKEENVWLNLANLHYRKDLRKFNEPIAPVQPQSLFRFHMKNSLKIYQKLFTLCKAEQQRIATLSKSILSHLPTCEQFSSSFEEALQLQDKSAFELGYTLINVRYCLQRELHKEKQSQKMLQQQQQSPIKKPDYIKKFIIEKNDKKVFSLLQKLSLQPQKSQQQQVLYAVSINILRTLLNFPSLADNYIKNQKYQLQDLQSMLQKIRQLNLEKGRFFVQMAVQCIRKNDFALLESALALALGEKELVWEQWMQEGIFHQQTEVRKIMLNFLLFYSLKNNFPLNMFQLNTRIDPIRCQEWFLLQYFYVRYHKQINITKVLSTTLQLLSPQSQTISPQAHYNPILNGNLNLLQVILAVHPHSILADKQQVFSLLFKLVNRTLSNDNRLLQYQLMFLIEPKQTLDYIEELITQVKPTEKYQIKENFVGIKNLGSTCYMNSILQQFFTITPFKHIVLTFPLTKVPAKSLINNIELIDDFMYQLQRMYTYLEKSNKKYFYPKEFCLTIKDYNKKPINTSIQQDAHEFLNNLFDKMETYMKEEGQLQKLEKVFQGKTICEISCKECDTKKEKIEDFYHLALEVKNFSTLGESFSKFISPQTIEDYFCQKCQKKSQQITKQTFIQQSPEILIINLQRIIFDLNQFKKVKVHSRLQFLQQLDLKEFTHVDSQHASQKYRLKGVVIHSGTSQGGHYYSLIKVGNEWFKFNDETVTRFSLSDLEREAFGGETIGDGWGDNQFSTNAYILFYEVEKGGERTKCQDEGMKEIKDNEGEMKEEAVKTGEREVEHEEKINNNVKLNHVDHATMVQQTQQQSVQINNPSPLTTLPNSPTYSPAKSVFSWQVQQQNKAFYKQLQIHQQSCFTFINKIYKLFRPSTILQSNPPLHFYPQWQHLPQLGFYQKILSIYLHIMRFFVTFNSISSQIITETGTNIYELITLLPESTYSLIHEKIDQREWGEIICAHGEIGVRELYKVVLNKVIFVYVKYYGWTYNRLEQVNGVIGDKDKVEKMDEQGDENQDEMKQNIIPQHQNQPPTSPYPTDRLTQILTHFLSSSTCDLISKNVFKSYYFFDFWLINIQMDTGIEEFCLNNNLLFILLDLLMSNQSPYAQKDKKRQDLPYEITVPLVQTILRLLYRKKNLTQCIPYKTEHTNQQQYHPLTTKESTILSSPQFYKRMMKLKYDNGHLSQIIFFMSANDKKFSQQLCQLFLLALNKLQQVDDAFALLNNIKAFVLVKDQWQKDRIMWMLGVPQFQHVNKMSYGLRHSSESSNVVYVSARYFIADQKYRPALQVLHDKKSYFSDFEIKGIITLLEIMLQSEQALKYILSIPPPCYLYCNYLTWIQEYARKLSNEDHYGLSMDKGYLAQTMEKLLQQVLDNVKKLNQPQTPILPKIIGKNKILQVQQQLSNDIYHIRKWTHDTYVLQNLPQPSDNQNLSLPDQIFNIKQLKSYAKYFIQNNDINECDIQIPSQKTVNTLTIETKKPLKLTFSLPYFTNQIYISKGGMLINYPYSDFPLEGYLEVEVLESFSGEKLEIKDIEDNSNKIVEENDVQGKMNYNKDAEKQLGYDGNGFSDVAGYGETIGGGFDGFQIPCEVCTYLNDSKRSKCQICQNPL